jgi:prepilin-type N-terminal cleavage/methylation domain-containing protein
MAGDRVIDGRRGLALIELLVVVAIIAVLAGLILIGVSRARSSTRAVQCLNNLRQIGSGFQTYAMDNSGRLPDPQAHETTWESMILKYLSSTAVLRCPADEEIYPSLGSSYDWRDTGDKTTSAAGRSIHACRPDAVLAFESLPGWHRRRMMQVVRLDGSALALHEQECLGDLRRSITTDAFPPGR